MHRLKLSIVSFLNFSQIALDDKDFVRGVPAGTLYFCRSMSAMVQKNIQQVHFLAIPDYQRNDVGNNGKENITEPFVNKTLLIDALIEAN